MNEQARANLAASLHSAVTDLSEVAEALTDLHTHDDIEQHAKALDRIAEDVGQGANVLRALIGRRKHSDTPARRVPPDPGDAKRVPPDSGGARF